MTTPGTAAPSLAGNGGGGWRLAIDRAIGWLATSCDVVLVAVLVALIAVMGSGAASRYLEGGALPWTDETASYLFVALTFFGAASGVWRNNHPRIDLLRNVVGDRARRMFDAVGLGALLSLLAVLIQYGVEATEQASDISMSSLPVSQGWAYSVVPITTAIMVVFLARNFFTEKRTIVELVLVPTTALGLYLLGGIAVTGVGIYIYLAGAMLLSLLIGVPVGFALSLTALVVLNSTDIPLDIVPQRLFDGTSSVILIAIPLFMLTGTLMSSGGMANHLAAFVTSIFGRIRGGLGIADVGASVIFADISGSAVADSAAIGSIMIPQMVRRGYSVEFASALQAAAGSLGLMFPPSSTMLVYAWVAGISVGGLFLHSFLPGLLVAFSFALVIYLYAVKRGYPRETTGGLRHVVATGKSAFFALMIPVLILVTILGGIMTPSESGVVAVLYTLVVGLVVYRNLKPRDLYEITLEAALSASRVTLIIASATLLSWVIVTFQGPQKSAA